MAPAVESFDVGKLGLASGEAKSVELQVPLEEIVFGGQSYLAQEAVPVVLDVSRTTTGHVLRIRFSAPLGGPCMRCLELADALVEIDVREIDQPGEDEELHSPYVDEGVVDLSGWVRDALVLGLPAQIVCREDCRGLCAVCGANLNDDPEHAHERPPDPRWAKLAELKLEE